MTQISIIGAGSWGTALAIVAARAGHEVKLWSRRADVVDSINTRRVNSRYLSAAEIPASVQASPDLATSLSGTSLVLLATPSHAVRDLLVEIRPGLDPSQVVVSVAKGIEIETGKRVSELVDEILGESWSQRFVCLSGPSFAKEVVSGHPTAIVAASQNEASARVVQEAFSFENFRIYTNNDVVGTEFGGSVKNVMAIAAGMTVGLGFGSNSVAALITRGLAEIARLSLSQGGQLETLMGLAGLGDLVLTCTGSLSRNRFVGEELGKGRTLEEITSGMNEVAEGVKTTRAVKQLAQKAGIEMPITSVVDNVLYEGKTARDAVTELMNRPLRQE